MKCPVDSAEMLKAEQEGIEIDYCPHCRGVWLERGELEKIVDRAVSEFEEQFGPEGPEDYSERPETIEVVLKVQVDIVVALIRVHIAEVRKEAVADILKARGGPEEYRRGGRHEAGEPRGGGQWEDKGQGYEDRGPPQGERRRSIFDIFNN